MLAFNLFVESIDKMFQISHLKLEKYYYLAPEQGMFAV